MRREDIWWSALAGSERLYAYARSQAGYKHADVEHHHEEMACVFWCTTTMQKELRTSGFAYAGPALTSRAEKDSYGDDDTST